MALSSAAAGGAYRRCEPPKISFLMVQQKSTHFVVGFNYLYYFWASDPSEYDVNRIAVTVNVEIYRKTAIRGCPVGS